MGKPAHPTGLAFKILAAGRLCNTQEDVRQAFHYTFSRIKPTDGVVIGLFPKSIDQVALDLAYAEEAAAAAQQQATRGPQRTQGKTKAPAAKRKRAGEGRRA